MKKTLYIISILFMQSCSIYSSYKAPEIIQNIDEQTDIPTWNEYFTDSNLSDLISIALENNSDLRIAKLNIEQADAILLSSKLSYLPSLNLGGEAGISKFSGSTSKTYSVPLTTQWEIDIFGKLRNTKQKNIAGYYQSKEYVNMVKSQLIAGIANSYYTLIMLDRQLFITKESIKNQKKNLDIIIALKEAGMQTEAAVNQAKSNYIGVQASEKDLELQINNLQNAISLLLNQAPGEITRSNFNECIDFGSDISKSISLGALANRPDVKYAEYELRKNFYNVNLSNSMMYPSLSLSGVLGWTNGQGGTVNPGEMLLSALGSLFQPIFNAGANRANLKISKAQYEQALIAFEKALLTAGNEVNNALATCETSSQKLILRNEQIKADSLALSNTKELMLHSSTTYLEILFAENSLLNSQLMQVADWFEGIRGKIELYKGLGGN